MIWDRLKNYYRKSLLIRSAINTYPDGICFAAMDGRPILANRAINSLCYQLTGHTVVNASAMWQELTLLASQEQLTQKLDRLILWTGDGRIWQFQRQLLRVQNQMIYQYEASDITTLEQYRAQLSDTIAREQAQQERQRELLKNIIQNNENKELLNAKIRVHDRFGRLLLMTRNTLSSPSDQVDDGLFESWQNTVTDMENARDPQIRDLSQPEAELLKVASMIGCQIIFEGERPQGREQQLLFYAAVREGLINAVRHSGANALWVRCVRSPQGYEADIFSNGMPPRQEIVEQGGLKHLRRRLEEEGASLQIVSFPEVHLYITLPDDRRSL